MATLLDDRSREVLKSLIQLHIATGEPVGSESLARTLNRSLSPATLRNIMADLEKLGYLAHPHTSAGRMPTDEGYRVYVDSLMRHLPLPARDAAAIDSELRPREGSSSEVMETASHILSRLSRNVGFVVAPEIGRTAFRHIDLVRLPHPRVLVVMVSSTGLVTHKVVELEEEIAQEQLQACANYLNTHFAGMTLSAIKARLLDLMRAEKSLYDSLLKSVIAIGERAFALDGQGAAVYLDGTSHILGQGFDDLDRMKALFKTFEEKSRLVKILNACISGGGIRVIIGHENAEPDLHDLAVVSAAYSLEGESAWGLGVLGSTRMEYARVIALVDHVARSVAHALEERRS
jgi:heat-inducible transcriptional repressor